MLLCKTKVFSKKKKTFKDIVLKLRVNKQPGGEKNETLRKIESDSFLWCWGKI